MKFTRCAAAFSIAIAALFAGCAGGRIDGRVISGTAGVAQVVELKADRPEDPGIAGATVEMRAVGRGGTGPVIGTATSGKDGRFSVHYPDRRMVRDRLQLTAKSDGYLPVQESFFLPGPGRAVLIMMKPGGTPAPAPAPAAKPRE